VVAMVEASIFKKKDKKFSSFRSKGFINDLNRSNDQKLSLLEAKETIPFDTINTTTTTLTQAEGGKCWLGGMNVCWKICCMTSSCETLPAYQLWRSYKLYECGCVWFVTKECRLEGETAGKAIPYYVLAVGAE
jgi:hypothetical protein